MKLSREWFSELSLLVEVAYWCRLVMCEQSMSFAFGWDFPSLNFGALKGGAALYLYVIMESRSRVRAVRREGPREFIMISHMEKCPFPSNNSSILSISGVQYQTSNILQSFSNSANESETSVIGANERSW